MVLTTDNIRASFDEFATVQVIDHGSNFIYLRFTTQREDVLQVSLHRNVWEQLLQQTGK